MKRFWQCPDCGGILEKNQATATIAGSGGGVAGSATCSYCGSSQSAGGVYGGSYDFAESDEFIARMGRDTGNVSFDQARMRWRYKGSVVSLASDQKKWWKFW